MAGTRTAPDVGLTAATEVQTTIHLIDASGDKFSDGINTLNTPTVAEVEAWTAAYQAATQASVWKVTVAQIWDGDADADNATTNQRNSIADGINLLYKNTVTNRTVSPRLIAPVAATMQGNQDIPLLSSAEMTALILAELAILTGYDLQSAQYTERRERGNNPRISA